MAHIDTLFSDEEPKVQSPSHSPPPKSPSSPPPKRTRTGKRKFNQKKTNPVNEAIKRAKRSKNVKFSFQKIIQILNDCSNKLEKIVWRILDDIVYDLERKGQDVYKTLMAIVGILKCENTYFNKLTSGKTVKIFPNQISYVEDYISAKISEFESNLRSFGTTLDDIAYYEQMYSELNTPDYETCSKDGVFIKGEGKVPFYIPICNKGFFHEAINEMNLI